MRGWASDIASAPKEGTDGDAIMPIDLGNASGKAFRSTCLEAARLACPLLGAICAAQWEPFDTRFWQRCGGRWVANSTMREVGRAQELCKSCLCSDQTGQCGLDGVHTHWVAG